MNIRELKKAVEEGTLDNRLLILECPENYFVANQYIKRISEFKHKEILYLDSLDVRDMRGYLGVYMTDVLEDNISTDLTDVIIKCIKVKTKGIGDYITTVPKLEDWQVQSYLANNLPGLSADQVKDFCVNNKYDIFMAQSLIDKLGDFDKLSQGILYNKITNTSGADINLFDFTSAILQKNTDSIKNMYSGIYKLDSFAVLNTLIKNFRVVLDIQFNQTPKFTEYSEKQYYATKKHSVGYYTNNQLIKIFDYLIEQDYLIKSMKKDSKNLIDDIMINVLGVE